MTDANAAARLVATALDLQSLPGPQDRMESLPAWSSLGHVRIVMELETALGRHLSAEEIVSLDSVPAVARILAGRVG